MSKIYLIEVDDDFAQELLKEERQEYIIEPVMRSFQSISSIHVVIHTADLEIDMTQHTVLKNGKALPMKPELFYLLHVLCSNPMQVMTRDIL